MSCLMDQNFSRVSQEGLCYLHHGFARHQYKTCPSIQAGHSLEMQRIQTPNAALKAKFGFEPQLQPYRARIL